MICDEYEARVAYDSSTDEDYTDTDMETIAIAQSAERVELGKDPIYLDVYGSTNVTEDLNLDTSLFGRIRGMFDSGASICCIDKSYAYKSYRKYIKHLHKFYVNCKWTDHYQ